MSSMRKIILKSSDGDSFEVDEAVALQLQTIKPLIEDKDDWEDKGIRLPNVTSKITSKVIEYCKKHVESPKSEDCNNTAPADDKQMVTLFELIQDLKHQIELDCADDDRLLNVIKILSKVIENHKKHVESPKSEECNNTTPADDELKAFDTHFVNVDFTTIIDLIMAADYLDIKSLLDLTCQRAADMMKGKILEGICELFTTPEEEKVEWALE